jgi:hypothetical protein
MPFIQNVKKTPFTITLTPTAKAILKKRASDAGLSQSEYIENLVRRGDSDIYDVVRQIALELLQITSSQANLQSQVTNNNQQLDQRLRDLLEAMGTSPNQIPDHHTDT